VGRSKRLEKRGDRIRRRHFRRQGGKNLGRLVLRSLTRKGIIVWSKGKAFEISGIKRGGTFFNAIVRGGGQC